MADDRGAPRDRADADTRRLAARSLADGDPTAWFDRLYVEAAHGRAAVPWDRPAPTASLVDRLAGRVGAGASAIVVGCGYGRDAEFVASLGYATTGFDVSDTVVVAARDRHPDSSVRYEQADLLQLPGRWARAFDLVVESNNVQSLPVALHEPAAAAVGSLVAPGGELVALAVAAGREAVAGPPWPLRRDEMTTFARDGLSIDEIDEFERDGVRRWWLRAHRPAR